ncbi:MAG: glutamate-cysteine ligase family protein [Gemmatimonadales bacterium]|nr:glutamate-cysteine ligase family protein [Gemmatimonadales bacterium]
MSQGIERWTFTDADFAAFDRRLRENLAAFRAVVARPGFGEGPPTLGAELELAIVDAEGRAAPLNAELLARSRDAHLTVEIDRFNLEYNLTPVPAAGRPFAAMRAEMEAFRTALDAAAAAHGARVLAIGILPTLEPSELTAAALTDRPRYRALQDALRRLRHGPAEMRINGAEPLAFTCDDVALEGANTSFQVHLRVPPNRFAAAYNAAQLATGPALAVAGNSPLFLGHQLWDETRIALFKKVMDVRSVDDLTARRPTRVSFGYGWLREGAAELFAEIVACFPPLMPIVSDAAADAGRDPPPLRELRLHNGTVWRWNRAIYDPDDGGHLRIELRALPAGPTSLDMLANAAFLVGLTHALAGRIGPMLELMPFHFAETNFYRAARDGLSAQLLWPSETGVSPREEPAPALVRRLLPLAAEGLAGLGVADVDAAPLLEVLAARVESGQTGARWQRATLRSLEGEGVGRREALQALVLRYAAMSREGTPVHAWAV